MPRLALILSGAASLGSYEAGVVSELLYALDHLWRSGEREYTLDVLTGASAGAMTSALIARAVMCDFAKRRALHDAWVNEIDIRDLLREAPLSAFLSKAPIQRIAEKHLGALDTAGERAIFAPERLRMHYTLSNMNGVDWRYPYARTGDAGFVSTFFADGIRLDLDETTARDTSRWELIRASAIASGNFPLAFIPEVLLRNETDYRDHRLAPFPGKFAYCDGGLFNNEPIGEAIDLALEADGGAIARHRKFILIDANLNRSAHSAKFSETDTLSATVMRLVSMIRGESVARDWLKSQRVNNEVSWRTMLLDQIVEMIQTTHVADPGGLAGRLHRAAAQIVERKREIFPDRYGPNYLEAALKRTGTTYAARLEGLSSVQREVLVPLIFVLNSVAGLDKKTQLDIDVIGAEKRDTAGDALGAFGGFFRRDWREYDYRLGRIAAHEQLVPILALDGPYPRESGFEHEYSIPPEWSDFRNATMRDADREPRIALRDTIIARFRGVMKQNPFGPRWLGWATTPLVGALAGRIVRKKLDEALGLE